MDYKKIFCRCTGDERKTKDNLKDTERTEVFHES